jgi:putative restriction endonuclease
MTRRDELVLAMNLYCQLPFGKLHARNREVIQLASRLNRTPSSVAMKLCNLASLDPAHADRGIRGLSKVSAGDRAIWEEFHADWNGLATESEALRERLAVGDVTPDEDAAPTENMPTRPTGEFSGATESTREVRVRLAQRFFRRAVISSYDFRCCVTGIEIRSLLIASHILPWSQYPDLRANPSNGLCLSRLHDAAFDRGLMTFDDEFRIVLSRELRDAFGNSVIAASFQAFEGRLMELPQKFCPNSEYLQIHRSTMFRG